MDQSEAGKPLLNMEEMGVQDPPSTNKIYKPKPVRRSRNVSGHSADLVNIN